MVDGDLRSELARLADEQAALRRVATLVAEDVAPEELFGAVAREVGTLLGGDFAGLARFEDDGVVPVGAWAADGEHPPFPARWPSVQGDPARTIATRRAATRWHGWTGVPGPIAAYLRAIGVRSTVGTPIVVKGRLWGAMALHSKHPAAFPPDTESRMQQFTELVSTAIANSEARAEVTRLAEEQAALRRVATLVAREASQVEVFSAIAEEIGRMPGVDECRMMRFENDVTGLLVSGWGEADGAFPIGSRVPLDDESAASRVFRTREPARIDDYRTVPGPLAEDARAIGIRSVVGAPVLVEGRVWGAVLVGRRHARQPLPEVESRLSQFTELVAAAVASTESRARADRLAGEQAALRRVATLVAQGAPLPEVHARVAEEVSRALGDIDCGLWRIEGDGTGTLVAITGSRSRLVTGFRSHMTRDGTSATELAYREGQPARVSDYSAARGRIAELARELGIRSSVACPIIVGGRAWGAMSVVSHDEEPFPPDTESRLAQFSELVATAIANAEARAEVERLAEEQAALRRVAILVAKGSAPTVVFDAVAAEISALLDSDHAGVSRYEPGGELAVLAHRGPAAPELPAGSRISHEGDSVEGLVYRTRLTARSESYEGARGVIAEMSHALGVRSAVAAPV